MRNLKVSLFSLVLGVALLSGCGQDPSKPPLDYVPHMFDSSGVKAQHEDGFGVAGRTPPEGTLAMNQEVYAYDNDPEGAGKNLSNPMKPTLAALKRGQTMFNTYCIVCHGPRGEGDGSVVPKFPRPPSLNSDKVRGWTDGRIFHVITKGQNLMPSYATQIAVKDRWALINYIRVIQRAEKPSADDVKAYESMMNK